MNAQNYKALSKIPDLAGAARDPVILASVQLRYQLEKHH